MMPDDPKSYQDLAVAYGMVGRSEKVLETYKKGIEVSNNLKDSMQLYQFLELAHVKSYAGELKFLEKSISLFLISSSLPTLA